jgi:hypothetical protein
MEVRLMKAMVVDEVGVVMEWWVRSWRRVQKGVFVKHQRKELQVEKEL